MPVWMWEIRICGTITNPEEPVWMCVAKHGISRKNIPFANNEYQSISVNGGRNG